MPRIRKPPRRWTEEEIKLLETFAGIRLPEPDQAAYFGLSRTYYDELTKKSEAAQRAIERGRSKAAARVRQTLYERAVGREAQVVRNRDGSEKILAEIPVCQRALEFWCKTQEGMRTTDRIELTGADGAPLERLDDQELDEKIRKISGRLRLGGDGGARREDDE